MPPITDWLMVGITAVYVIATIVICCANLEAASATREQLAESKRQFDEDNRAAVTVTFDIIRSGLLVLCIHNHGKRVANNVEIQVSPEFLNNMGDESSKALVHDLCASRFSVGIDQKWYICLGSHLELGRLGQVPLMVNIRYSDNFGQYNENVVIDLKQYRWALMYDSPMEDANNELKKLVKSLQKIEKIAKG